jgi:hypothetical protein
MKGNVMNQPTRDNRFFHPFLIPTTGDAKRMTCAWNDPEQAFSFAATQAVKLFPGQAVEVVIIHTMSNTVAVSRMVGEKK